VSYFPWTYLGANFNGREMPLADYHEVTEKVMSFWDLFKKECPDVRTEIRGTNFGTGMDLAKDYIPMQQLYDKKYIEFPPPNSPWGALNYDFGLEITGYLSRIAELPGEVYPFRFYANDPWFWQNPWWDLYDREPHDIYVPLSAARVNRQGELESPGIIEILTIDTEKGELNAECPAEVIPHLRRALRDAPDQPGLLTWLYPFRELHEAVEESNEASGDVFFHDWFIRNAINQGLPLNTVISTDQYLAMTDEALKKLNDTVLLVATSWLTGDKALRISNFVQSGGKVILYGAVKEPILLDLLHLAEVDGIEGDVEITALVEEDLVEGEAGMRQLRHLGRIASGGLAEQVRGEDGHTRLCAVVNQGEEERAFALTRSLPEWHGGKVGWVRGSLPFLGDDITHLPIRQAEEWADSAIFLRYLQQDFGYTILQTKRATDSPSALFFVTRHQNGFLINGCKQDTSVQLRLLFPEGSPILIGESTMVGGDEKTALYALGRTFHEECRVFVKQEERSRVSCREHAASPTQKKQAEREIAVSGLKQATVTIYPPLAALEANRVEVKHNGITYLDLTGTRDGNRIRISKITGTIEISW
jgi:hypothetical protein